MSKYAMTMTAFKRAHYLEHVLVSLANNKGLENYVLHFGVEPVDQEVIETCNKVRFMNSTTTVNQKRLGVRENPFQLLKRTFETGVDGVLYLEDDVTLSPDAVEMASWYFAQPRRNDFLCMNLYNHDSDKAADPAVLFPGKKFSALGMAITKEQWKQHFEPNWMADPRGWDYSFTNMISTGLRVLQPRISRSHHIGRLGGVHYLPQRDDKIYANNPMWEGASQQYRIEEEK